MRKVWMAAAVAVAVMLLAFYMLGGLAQDPQGFLEDDLNAPAVTSIARDESLPGPLSGTDYPMHIMTSISYTRVYEDYGGVAELAIENDGNSDVYVRNYGLRWEGTNASFTVNCSRIVAAGEAGGMGPLYFPGPGKSGISTLEVSMNLWVSSVNGALWSDKGELSMSDIDLVVQPEAQVQARDVQKNPVKYYNRVNELVDLVAVEGMMEDVLDVVPGNFSLRQVIEAYELVRSQISYAPDDEDHWQAPAETIGLGAGDCEDHAILLASLLTALGGDCRINLISGHAFPSVFVGNGTSDINLVIGNIQAFYGNELPMHWIEDDLGFWLVIDTVGMPYVGGYPAASAPAGGIGGENWNFEEDHWLKTIDVTGETVAGLVL